MARRAYRLSSGSKGYGKVLRASLERLRDLSARFVALEATYDQTSNTWLRDFMLLGQQYDAQVQVLTLIQPPAWLADEHHAFTRVIRQIVDAIYTTSYNLQPGVVGVVDEEAAMDAIEALGASYRDALTAIQQLTEAINREVKSSRMVEVADPKLQA